ncbi:MAG TPA: DUF1839 family protein [Polyangiaceae bacterium]
MSTSALGILPDQYQSHALHSGDRAWLETNCYVDLWIEVVHALGLEPRAALPFTLALDFEGDQWLFYKQPTSDLYDLYGIDVQELAIWRPLLAHCSEQVARGRLVLVEVDAFHLPDTRGVSYGTEHAKTTIGVERIDRDREELGYFHNAGYFTLRGADFAALFGARKRDELAPYTEFAKFDRLERLPERELVTRSLALLRRHLLRAPRENPFTRFAARFPADVAALSADTPQAFHQYAFTTLRQCGSCCELAGSYLRWLEQHGQAGLTPIAEHFERLASAAKGMQLGAARAVLKKRPFSPEASLAEMASDWARAMEQLQVRYAS